MLITNSLAAAASLGSALIFYLGCPNQQWLEQRPLGFAAASVLASGMSALSWWLLSFGLAPLSATFAVVVLFMLFLGVVPFLSRYAAPAKARGKRKKKLEKGEVEAANGQPYSPQWVAKTTIVFLLAYPLALSISGLLAIWGGGTLTHDTKSQAVMWLITPLWLTPLSLAYFTVKVKTLLIALAILNAIFFAMLQFAKGAA